MKNKPIIMLIVIIITITITLSITILYINRTDSVKKSNTILEKSKLSEYLSEYNKLNYKINVLRIKDKIIYGTIETNKYDNFLYTTVGIFKYYIEDDRFCFRENTTYERIIDFIELDDNLYYCVLNYQEDNLFKWTIYHSSWNEKKAKLIEEACVKGLFDYPRMFYYNNMAIVLLKSSEPDNVIHYKFCKIDIVNNNMQEVISDKGNTIRKEGTLVYNDDNFMVVDNKIFYTVVNSDDSQSLMCYDMNSLKFNNIYTNKDINKGISFFTVTTKEIFIELIDKKNIENTINIILNADNVEIYRFKSKELTFPNLVNNNKILFHNSDNSWEIFDFANKENNLKKINIQSMELQNIFPKYFVVNETKILLQTFGNEFYYVDLKFNF